jgi:hypothetical protein
MVLRKPLATLALAGGAFGLSMGIGYAVASATTGASTTSASTASTGATNVSTTGPTSSSSSSGSTSTTTPTHPCPNMGGSGAPQGSGSATPTG